MPREARTSRWVAYAALVALVLSLATILLSLPMAWRFEYELNYDLAMQCANAGMGVFPLAMAAWAVTAFGFVRSAVSRQPVTPILLGRMERIESVLESQEESLRKLIDLATLSDRAKGLIYRQRELEAFLETIHADLIGQDYESAEALIASVESSGYQAQAARLREEVAKARQSTNDEKIDASLLRVQEILGRCDWPRAQREAARLLQALPDHPKIIELPRKIEQARNRRKKDLLQQYGDAVRKNAIDDGIALLQQLDSYLSPQEAAALRDSARGVFRAKLHNLGVQFAICVTDQRWQAAVETGEQIMRDFPNTRMAHEVHEKIDALRARASGTKS